MLVRYISSCMCVRLSIFSRLSIKQYVGFCVFSLPITLVMIGRIYISLSYIIIIKSEVWTHRLGLAHETMICAVCLSIFLVTMLLNLKDCMFPINKIRHVNMLVKYWVLSFSVPWFRENHDLKFCRQSEAILVYRQVTPKDKTPRPVSWYVPDSCCIAVQRLQLVSICNASTFNNVWMCYKKGFSTLPTITVMVRDQRSKSQRSQPNLTVSGL